VVDPEKWVPDGYACVRVDSRGAGRFAGLSVAITTARETRDIHLCVEWAAAASLVQRKVGMNGISYYASNQWRAAASQPPHLAAICVWKAGATVTRDGNRHGASSAASQELAGDAGEAVQHGQGERGAKNRVTGDTVCGPETLSPEQLEKNRENMWQELLSRPSKELTIASAPPISPKSWSRCSRPRTGAGRDCTHAATSRALRGQRPGRSGLEVHGGSHWAPFYTDYGVTLQKTLLRSFPERLSQRLGQAAARAAAGQASRRKVSSCARERMAARAHEVDALPPRSEGNEFVYCAFSGEQSIVYEAMGEGVTFSTRPLERETEITGPSALTLFVSSSTADADLFCGFCACSTRKERKSHSTGRSTRARRSGRAGLRASQRSSIRNARCLTPFPRARREAAARAGRGGRLDIEIWPTCIVVPAGFRVALTIRGKDYEHDGEAASLSNMKNPMRGLRPFIHDDETDRPLAIFAEKSRCTLGRDGARASCCL